jgi:hypothetical protein
MTVKAPTYSLLQEYGNDPTMISASPHWAVVVVRLGLPLSYSRKKRNSVTNDVSQGAHLRGPNLVIVSDCFSLMVQGSKDSHVKSLAAEMKQTDHNYLVEILPGDWVLAWMVNGSDRFDDLLTRIQNADPDKPCNQIEDGLKFIGRVDSVRTRLNLDRSTGMRTTSVTVTANGFHELDTEFFYDQLLSDADSTLGTWLTRIGLDIQDLFSIDIKKGQKNNSSKLISALLELLVGKGIKTDRVNQAQRTVRKNGLGEFGNLNVSAGGGTTGTGDSAPYAYLVPKAVGAFLGRKTEDASKNGGILSYADILDTIMGVQNYGSGGSDNETLSAFMPDSTSGQGNRMFTGKELLGTYIPVMPQFTNKPLWSIFQQFLNPVVNEMYTCLRANHNGLVMPTLVVRQIPFTTEAFVDESLGGSEGPLLPGQSRESLAVTKFLEVPRWIIHDVMVNNVDIGRSDATRINFVHIYGQDANLAEQVTFTEQLTTNPPARDDLDIQRSGLRPFMTTVACSPKDQVGKSPSAWINLAADRLIGSHLTLNGTLQSVGITAPIAEGDNLEWKGVVYHIESLSHHCVVGPTGEKAFDTTLTLTNGMRSDRVTDTSSSASGSGDAGGTPVYPGFLANDNTQNNPGLSVDDKYDRTAPTVGDGDLVTPRPPGADDNSRELTDEEFMETITGVKIPQNSSSGGGLDDL